jgi:hypothetical protein
MGQGGHREDHCIIAEKLEFSLFDYMLFTINQVYNYSKSISSEYV